jgi:thymidylate kinase
LTAPIEQDVDAILPLMGDEVRVLHPRRGVDDQVVGGGDLDCAVFGFDEFWPLRLPSSWRLLMCVRYDITGSAWVLEHDGRIEGLDALVDPKGLGRYGFPTLFAFPGAGIPLDATRAAYLTSKRITKRIADPVEWEHIRSLSQVDLSATTSALGSMFGRRIAVDLMTAIREGVPPDAELMRRARRGLAARRFRGIRAWSIMGRSFGRVFGRVLRPTGFSVLIVGPNGAGKTTLANGLARSHQRAFPRYRVFPWRPNVLPGLALTGASEGDPTRPHARPPHKIAVSLLALAYHWTDFLAGNWLRIWPLRARTTLVIFDGGCWDLAVDPLRYRLRIPAAAERVLNRLLPRPDLVFVLDAPPELLLGRNVEVSENELLRHGNVWRDARFGCPTVFLDASRRPDAVVADALDHMYRVLERRSIARLGPGWIDMPSRRSAPLTIPRGPRAAAKAGLQICQPVTFKELISWSVARAATSLGALRLLPRGDAPPREVREALAPYIPPRSTVTVMKANHRGRYVATITDMGGTPRAWAKIATDQEGRAALAREADAISRLGSLLSAPVTAPRVIERTDGVLLLEPVTWEIRLRPKRLPTVVAAALGNLFRKSAVNGLHAGGAHGDCAPWNLLRSGPRWVLVDWEEASHDAPPLFDVLHYHVQSLILLERRSAEEILETLTNPNGRIHETLDAYVSAAGLAVEDVTKFIGPYLEFSGRALSRAGTETKRGRFVRQRMLRMIDGANGRAAR